MAMLNFLTLLKPNGYIQKYNIWDIYEWLTESHPKKEEMKQDC